MSFLSWLRGESAGGGARAPREIRMTWKVVRIDGPMREDLGLATRYGVIVSSDTMLEQTQTLLFCPIMTGEDGEQVPERLMPWHVQITFEKHAEDTGTFPFARAIVSTKIVLPISLNEIDRDGKERGRLDRDSRQRVATTLRKWLPLFTDASGY